jgi:hypothetical protein
VYLEPNCVSRRHAELEITLSDTSNVQSDINVLVRSCGGKCFKIMNRGQKEECTSEKKVVSPHQSTQKDFDSTYLFLRTGYASISILD